MLGKNFSLFSKTKELENKIDLFHDKMIDATMTFKKAIKIYLASGRSDEYRKVNKQIKLIEHDADALRRDIESKLYSQNLIPDLRADVLNLVESLDKVTNKLDEVTYRFYIERPEWPEEFNMRLMELCEQISDCVENTAMASRAFFKNFSSVRDFAQKVYFMEHETDVSSGHLKEAIFNSAMPLANKLQLSSIVYAVANIADTAEDCIDKLLIFTIKRDI